MKQKVVIEENESSDSQPSRKEKMDKKRMIRKTKTQTFPLDLTQLRKIDTSTLSREEKAKLQKAKNREAAQKSRDSHKEYVANLEKEVGELRERLSASRKICWKCQRQLEETSNHESSLSDPQTDQRSKSEKIYSFQRQEEMNFKDESQIEHFQHFEQESFMRAQQSREDHSYFKMILFVSMIVVAAFFIGSANPQVEAANGIRALMEIPENPEVLAEKAQKTVLTAKLADQQQKNTNSSQQTAIVPVEKGLIALNTDDCLNSLMTVETIQVDTKRSLRTYHESAPSPTYLASQQGILLCTVRTPKPYESRFQKLRSPLVKLYLLGSQIKEMLTHSNLLIPIRDTNIQINGLYRVAAQIKDVSLVNDHNCLL